MSFTRNLLLMDTVGKPICCIVPSRPALLFNLSLLPNTANIRKRSQPPCQIL